MTFKDILVHLDDDRGHETRLRLACNLARRHEAHLTALFGIEPLTPVGLASPATSAYADIETMQIVQEKRRQAVLAVAGRIETAFGAETARAGVSGEWRIVEGEVADLITLHARYADLAILGQIDPDNPPPGSAASLPESVLLGSGGPVLVIPYVGRLETLGRNVLIAWNGSREAARAVRDALPLLMEAKSVTVLSANQDRGIAGEGNLSAADLSRHLARHAVTAEASNTVGEDIAIGDMLLSRAADLGTDLIVMGGYGHSRMRELILGGATRALLRHMTVPVLLSH